MYPILTYGFPLLLILFEWGTRKVIEVDTQVFIGPALSVSGICYLVPLLKPKVTNINFYSYKSKFDSQLIPFLYLLVLLSIFGWIASCILSIKEKEIIFLGINLYLWIGIIIYFVSIVMVVLKE
ncbi:hypothetical protein ACG59Z_18570, partial [Acinetobacter sp. ABJ_C1_1]|uniref:hypothetical protein n=1 Tax=Acinetobacter sp. ABJ_C1_1 TaxID=3378321 RepID=UPI0037DDDED8